MLLKNKRSLPLDATKVRSIAVIGPHADVGMISGGGSAQVDPPGGNAILPPGQGRTHWQEHIWFPTSPFAPFARRFPRATVSFDSGANPAIAAALAKSADIAVVFAYQWESEGMDLDSLSLPEKQDDLIAQVAAANPHTIVVLETGGPVTMPWVGNPAAILEAWYGGQPGSGGGRERSVRRRQSDRQIARDFSGQRRRPPASHDRKAAQEIAFPRRTSRLGRSAERTSRLSNYLRRRPQGRLQMVRRGAQAGAFPLWPRAILHDVLVLRAQGHSGKKREREFYSHQLRQPRRRGDCGSLCRSPGERGRTAQTAGGLEQSQTQCGRKRKM